MSNNPTIQQKRGYNEALMATDPVLLDGEIVYNKTDNSLKIGDGVSKWSQLDKITGGSSLEVPPNDNYSYVMRNGEWVKLDFDIIGASLEPIMPKYMIQKHKSNLYLNSESFENFGDDMTVANINNYHPSNTNAFFMNVHLTNNSNKKVYNNYISFDGLQYKLLFNSIDQGDNNTYANRCANILYPQLVAVDSSTNKFYFVAQQNIKSPYTDSLICMNNITTETNLPITISSGLVIDSFESTSNNLNTMAAYSSKYALFGSGKSLHAINVVNNTIAQEITLNNNLTGLVYVAHANRFVAQDKSKYIYVISDDATMTVEKFYVSDIDVHNNTAPLSIYPSLFYIPGINMIINFSQSKPTTNNPTNSLVFSQDGYIWIKSLTTITGCIMQILYANSIKTFFLRVTNNPDTIGYHTVDFKHFYPMQYNKETLYEINNSYQENVYFIWDDSKRQLLLTPTAQTNLSSNNNIKYFGMIQY